MDLPPGPAISRVQQKGPAKGPAKWAIESIVVAMLIARSAQMKSDLTKKGSIREWAKMKKRLPSGVGDAKELPRRRSSSFEQGKGGDDEWCAMVDEASETFGKAHRAQSTSAEHDLYMWGFNEWAKRQGFASYVERVKEGEHPPLSSSTGKLKPTYACGEVRVVRPQVGRGCREYCGWW